MQLQAHLKHLRDERLTEAEAELCRNDDETWRQIRLSQYVLDPEGAQGRRGSMSRANTPAARTPTAAEADGLQAEVERWEKGVTVQALEDCSADGCCPVRQGQELLVLQSLDTGTMVAVSNMTTGASGLVPIAVVESVERTAPSGARVRTCLLYTSPSPRDRG